MQPELQTLVTTLNFSCRPVFVNAPLSLFDTYTLTPHHVNKHCYSTLCAQRETLLNNIDNTMRSQGDAPWVQGQSSHRENTRVAQPGDPILSVQWL